MSVIRHLISVPLDAVKIQKEVSYVFAKLDSWPVKMELTALVITALLYKKIKIGFLIHFRIFIQPPPPSPPKVPFSAFFRNVIGTGLMSGSALTVSHQVVWRGKYVSGFFYFSKRSFVEKQ